MEQSMEIFYNIQVQIMKNILLICLFCGWLGSAGSKKLIFVQELFRHGARYPIYASADDGTEYVDELKSDGELTTQGKKMHYLLGQKIYQQYWSDLFKNTPYENNYNQSKFYFRSTDVHRTIESCQSHLMGIFQKTQTLHISNDQANFSSPLWPGAKAQEGNVFPNAVDYHPLPIHVFPSYSKYSDPGDFLRAYSPEVCPNQDLWTIQNHNDKFVQEVRSNENFTQSIEQLGKSINKQLTFSQAAQKYDNFMSTQYLGRTTLPIFKNPKYKRQLEYIYVLDLYINLFYSHQQLKTTSSRFFEATIKNMKKAIKHRDDVQWVVYSAHDTTVGNMLAALNMTNVACIYEAYQKGDNYNDDKCIAKYPGYTASLIFQVWEDESTMKRTFKIRYKGEVKKIPFCNYTEECSVEKFQSWWKENMHQPYFLSACGITDTEKNTYLSAAIVQFFVILVILIYFLVQYLKKRQQEKNISRKAQESMLSENVD